MAGGGVAGDGVAGGGVAGGGVAGDELAGGGVAGGGVAGGGVAGGGVAGGGVAGGGVAGGGVAGGGVAGDGVAGDGVAGGGVAGDELNDRGVAGSGRSRDAAGRARNARPRDGLGRPMSYGAMGVPRQPEGIVRTPEQTLTEAHRLLQAGRPFHAHEVFEDAWKAAAEPEREFWKALAQLAVGATHALRGNPIGARRLLDRGAAALALYKSSPPYGMDVAGLLAWVTAVGAAPTGSEPFGAAPMPLRWRPDQAR